MYIIGLSLTGVGVDDIWHGPNPLWLSLLVTVTGVTLIVYGLLRRA